MIDESSTLQDIAFAVCTVLDRAGIEAVLTGGSAAVYYSSGEAQSLDADFVLRYGANGDEVRALAAIGFVRHPNGFFAHERSRFTVEFVPGPLAVGTDILREHAIDRREGEILRVLTPTDCVRDRFIAYYAWGDISALTSALAVAHAIGERFDMRSFTRWAKAEARSNSSYDLERLALFLHRYSA